MATAFLSPQHPTRIAVAPSSPQKKYVLQFSSGAFLRDYSEGGSTSTKQLENAKLFSAPPRANAELFRARIIVVHVDGSGGLRRTLLSHHQPCGGDGRRDAGVSQSATALGECTYEEAERKAIQQESSEEVEPSPGNREASGSGQREQLGPDASKRTSGPAVEVGAAAGTLPPSFLVKTLLKAHHAQLEDGRSLFYHFVASYLDCHLQGVQSGFGVRPDMYLIEGPMGSTLCVDVNVMLQPQEIARAIVQSKLIASEQAFRRNAS